MAVLLHVSLEMLSSAPFPVGGPNNCLLQAPPATVTATSATVETPTLCLGGGLPHQARHYADSA